MKEKRIIAISAGQYEHKKETDLVKKHIRYLNYGLLGLVTMIYEKLGLDIVMLQGDNCSPKELIERIEMENINIAEDCEYVMLSIPSNYSLSWCTEFCEIIKARFNKKIIVGGRWVIDNNAESVKEKLKYADYLIEGFGEKKIAELLCPQKAHLIQDGALQCFEHLNYELLVDYKKYQPSIEISRGCGSKCKFCADRNNKRLPNKPVKAVMEELDYFDRIYGEYSVYLEAPHFVFSKEWCEEFMCEMQKRERIIPWRCTTRVESVPLGMIGNLAKSGLKILDIGLESASYQQLLRMNKTKNPQENLNKAVKILEECKKYGVWVKLNILFFAGETAETVKETVDWLKKYKHLIKGVSVSSLVYYKGAGDIEELLKLGAILPENNMLDECGYADLDLSEEISCKKAKEIALQISQMIMTKKDYFDIKSVSYFERGYTYEEFEKDVISANQNSLCFSTESNV